MTCALLENSLRQRKLYLTPKHDWSAKREAIRDIATGRPHLFDPEGLFVWAHIYNEKNVRSRHWRETPSSLGQMPSVAQR